MATLTHAIHRRLPAIAACMVSGLVIAQAPPPVRPGLIVKAPAGCSSMPIAGNEWRPISLRSPAIAHDTWLRCAAAGMLHLRLPGNGAKVEVYFPDPGFQYLVPIGRDLPALSKDKTPGRVAEAIPIQPGLLDRLHQSMVALFRTPGDGDQVISATGSVCGPARASVVLANFQDKTQALLQESGLGVTDAVLRSVIESQSCARIVGRMSAEMLGRSVDEGWKQTGSGNDFKNSAVDRVRGAYVKASGGADTGQTVDYIVWVDLGQKEPTRTVEGATVEPALSGDGTVKALPYKGIQPRIVLLDATTGVELSEGRIAVPRLPSWVVASASGPAGNPKFPLIDRLKSPSQGPPIPQSVIEDSVSEAWAGLKIQALNRTNAIESPRQDRVPPSAQGKPAPSTGSRGGRRE